MAGNGTAGYSGNGGAATSAELWAPTSVAVDGSGNIYIADKANNRVRVVYASGTVPNVQNPTVGYIYTVAGNGTAGYSGDGGAATSAELDLYGGAGLPTGVAVDASGNIYIADYENQRIRVVYASGTVPNVQNPTRGYIYTVAGNGTAGYSGNGGAATSAELSYPAGVAVDASGNIYIAGGSLVREVTASTGKISTVAGDGTAGYSGDGGAATSAELDGDTGVAVDASGNIYIADWYNQRIRTVTASTGIITTMAGDGVCGQTYYGVCIAGTYSGDGGMATSAGLDFPYGVAVDARDNVYIADSDNNRIRAVGAPSISSLSPISGAVGSSVTITGTNFGASKGTSTVAFNGTTATSITSWSNTSIVAVVPTGATTGNVVVTVSGVASNASTFTVQPSTMTTLSSSSNPADYGTSVILSATVSAASGPTPTGIVLFYDGSSEIGSGTLQSGNAAFTTSSLSVGTHSLTASYQGSSTDPPSTSAVLSQVIQQVPTTTTATLSPATAAPLQPIVVTINVTDTVGSYPAGTVNCTATGTSQTFSGSLSGGTATWTLTNLTAGSYTVSCSYAGSTDFAASTAIPVTANVVVPTNTWTATASESSPIFEQSATLLPSGAVLIAGGSTGNGDEGAQSIAQLYVPGPNGIGTFEPTGSLVQQRFGHTANVVTVGPETGDVLIAGGENYQDTQLSTAEIYSGNSFALSPASLNYARSMHTATTLQDGTILIAGGYTGCVGCGTSLLPQAEVYTPELGCPTCVNQVQGASFTVVGSLNTPRDNHTATLLQNGEVLIAGGQDNNGNQLASAELYNPVTGNFTYTGSMNTARAFHEAVLLPNGEVLIVGGNGTSGNPTNTAELYNPTTGTFTTTGSMITARYYPGAALLNNGNVIVFGGGTNNYNGSFNSTAESEIYNTSTGTFSATTSLNTPRTYSTTIVLPGGNVLALTGEGSSSNPILSSSEVYSVNETITGVINPKYLIVGITYAPPGPSSFISYTDTSYVGNTSDITTATGNDTSISGSATLSVGGGSGGGGGGANGNGGKSAPVQGWNGISITGTAGSEHSQTTTNENTYTWTSQLTNGYKTGGTPNALYPVDHDYDIIWLWLNPTVVYTVDMSSPNAAPTWNGYGYDSNDPNINAPDIVGINVGYLNGDLSSSSVTTYLERQWAQNEGLIWPNGDTAALTPTDYANILAADPFTNSNYSVILPSPCSAPCTTTDGRFTEAMSPTGSSEYIQYLQEVANLTSTYTETYAATSTASKTVQNQYKVSWGVSGSLSGYFGFKLGISLSDSGSMTVTNTTKTSTTTTDTQATQASVTSPPCSGSPCSSYSGQAPQQPPIFDIYQDDLYGGLVFWGVN